MISMSVSLLQLIFTYFIFIKLQVNYISSIINILAIVGSY